MEEGEEFVGGFAGGLLARGIAPGYGVYATTRRIIGVKLRKTEARAFLRGATAGLVEGQLIPKLSIDESAMVIEELDQKKEFDMAKSNISRIEIKHPGLLTGGYLSITPRVGEETRIRVLHRVAFERLRELMQTFYPEAVTLA